ncbi:histidine decarboxylase [Stylonychia lemnae]|uniref:Histidine decarboxylase n=1 Tax=Stylonychia lemnae TaxID=5949 RepID=A0A078B1C5_STYLE|nr:histidine decarboxylase [Stylonychia lemnae]|eukprot:CDW86978.1 histidine decarboxylase [Stylonychia lemnae]
MFKEFEHENNNQSADWKNCKKDDKASEQIENYEQDFQPQLRFHNHEKTNLQSFHQNLQRKFQDQTMRQLSFPIRNHNFEHMSPYLRYYLNNHGDSFQEYRDYFSLRTRQFEKQVIHWFSQLYRSPNSENVWGYMPSGSTESIIKAFYQAREYFKDRKGMAVFFSQQAHSSVNKSIVYLKMNSFSQLAKTKGFLIPKELEERGIFEWPERVPTQQNGEIDYELLKYLLKPFAEQEIPIAISLTIGATIASNFDNTQKVIDVLNSYEFNLSHQDIQVVLRHQLFFSNQQN